MERNRTSLSAAAALLLATGLLGGCLGPGRDPGVTITGFAALPTEDRHVAGVGTGVYVYDDEGWGGFGRLSLGNELHGFSHYYSSPPAGSAGDELRDVDVEWFALHLGPVWSPAPGLAFYAGLGPTYRATVEDRFDSSLSRGWFGSYHTKVDDEWELGAVVGALYSFEGGFTLELGWSEPTETVQLGLGIRF